MNSAAPAAPGGSAAAGYRRQIMAWGLWDWGSAAFNAVILTFVFSVYLTDSVGRDLPGGISANSWLGWALGAAGLLIALLAPVVGQGADRAGKRLRSTLLWTIATVTSMALLFGVRDDYRYLWLGLLLLSAGSIFFQLAEVSYNAILRQISRPATIGRVSGFGWAMGYFGGIVLLLALYLLIIAGNGDGTAGLLAVHTAGGLNIRLVALVAAGWFALSAIPLFVTVRDAPTTEEFTRLGVAASYRRLFTDLRELYRTNPHTVYFLGASALFRDGLAGVFTFGAVFAVTVYGIAPDAVLIFGVAANVVSAIGALGGGWVDDRYGPKPLIIGSLAAMIGCGLILLFVSGPTAYWVLGLGLSLFLGPAQSGSRTFLARLSPPGREGQLFGLYATTGRAVSFLAPALVGFFTYAFNANRAGIAGILLVLLAGLLALIPVRAPVNVRQSRTGQPGPG